jgi:hypothetical protein
MSATLRSIEEIDRSIDANTRALMTRLHCDPGMSAHNWQNAWDRCPDLRQRRDALYRERGEAQVERDRLEEREYQRQQRSERAKRRHLLRRAEAA